MTVEREERPVADRLRRLVAAARDRLSAVAAGGAASRMRSRLAAVTVRRPARRRGRRRLPRGAGPTRSPAPAPPTESTSAPPLPAPYLDAAAPPRDKIVVIPKPGGLSQLGEMLREHRLEVLAVALLALGGGVFPLHVWLAGAALILVAGLWDRLDAAIGLLTPVVLAVLGSLSVGTRQADKRMFLDVEAYVQAGRSAGPELFRVGAVLGAGYLLLRLLTAHRRT